MCRITLQATVMNCACALWTHGACGGGWHCKGVPSPAAHRRGVRGGQARRRRRLRRRAALAQLKQRLLLPQQQPGLPIGSLRLSVLIIWLRHGVLRGLVRVVRAHGVSMLVTNTLNEHIQARLAKQ